MVKLNLAIKQEILIRITNFKLKHKNKYKFILEGGASLKNVLYNIMQNVWEREKKPKIWRNTNIVQLYKGKGSVNELSNQRNIHTKSDTRKLFGDIVVTAAKDKIINGMTKFQIGTKPGHRAQEHIFCIKSVISLYLQQNCGLLLNLWDVQKFFDRENLRDCLSELYKCNIKGKLYRLIYELNCDTIIKVQTPVGYTEERETGETVGQGTNEGALISAANIDGGVKDFSMIVNPKYSIWMST